MADSDDKRADDAEGWFPWLLVIAVILMLISVIWEASTEAGPLDLWHLGKDLVNELAVAVFIGWVISVGIERASRLRDAREAETRRQAISENVVSGVFGVQYPANYVKAVIDTHLSPRVVRLSYQGSYVIRPLSENEVGNLGVDKDRFVVFSATRSFKFKNVSSRSIDFPVGASIPVRRSAKLRDFARMRTVTFDGVELKADELNQGLEATSRLVEHKTYRWVRKIGAGETLTVVFDSVMIKELSDNELWWNAHPTLEGASFNVMVPPGMNFGLEAVSSGDLIKEFVSEPEGKGTWKIDSPVLPNESVVFWWRSPADDGEQEGQVPEPTAELVVNPA